MSNFVDEKENKFVNDFVSFLDCACSAFHAVGKYFNIYLKFK